METYGAETYGERIADVYDGWYGNVDETIISILAELAQGGRALELGIGTGRIALPLQERGIEMHGIDASEAMVAKLRQKPGGANIPVTIGSFADFDVEGEFSLIFVAFNTFYGLLTQEEQIQCFRCAVRHLTPDGVFLLEVFVPNLNRFTDNQTLRALSVDTDEMKLEATHLDIVTQQIVSQHVCITEQGIRLLPVKLRYAWPSELDLMAQLAGMRLRSRWGGWQQQSFTAKGQRHISLYERTA
jgi:SAM-dependent methyltransferase